MSTSPSLSTLDLPPLTTAEPDCGLTRSQRAEQTRLLLHAAQECDDEAESAELLERVVLINRGVADAVAARYRNRGVPADDLRQVAYEGLTKAVRRFDPSRGEELLTFAVPTIRGEVQRYFRDQGWTVRPPRRIQENQSRMSEVLDRLSQSLGHEPTEEEVADELGISTEEYRESRAAFGCFHPTSLDQPAAGGETPSPLGELLSDTHDDGEAAEAAEARVALAPVVRQLPERDRRILYLRFFEDLTQEEIGRDLGVTQMQVSRLLARILTHLRDDLERDKARSA